LDIARLPRRTLLIVRVLIWLAAGMMYFTVFMFAGRADWSDIHVFAATSVVGFIFSIPAQYAVVRSWNLSGFRRTSFLVASIILIAAVHSIFDTVMAEALEDYPELVRSFTDEPSKKFWKMLLFSGQTFEFFIWIHAFFAAFAWTIIRSQLMFEQERRLAEAESQAQKAVLSALRAQVNPHFLFNALNAISSLMTIGRYEEAEEALMRLSEFFRASLAAERRQLVTVADELEMLEAYLEMEQLRFPDRLKANIVMGEGTGAGLIPSFLLQPLVENAIKYAVAPSTEPVDVIISSRRTSNVLQVSVEDTGNSAGGSIAPGEGVGLENVRSRIEAIYGDSAIMTVNKGNSGFQVTITLPFSDTPATEAKL
jgi:signal transduction histidine kinase